MLLIKTLLIFISLTLNFQSMEIKNSIYDISIPGIDGNEIEISEFKGKYVLFVNVASKCGFTGQYENMQSLYEKYKSKLVVVGLPCNQFGMQEPGKSHEISTFCTNNYNVTFVMTEKIKVKGNDQHPLYKWLTNKDLNNVSSSGVRWNFQKYLIDPNGNLIDYWYSLTSPTSNKITKHLQ